jgi:pimeloyl-ACP methyl ester carboxylesterase
MAMSIIVLFGCASFASQPLIKRSVKIPGATIHYEEKGRGFPIVFVSGGGILDLRCWDEQFENFAKDYRVVRYDVRGIGKSSRPTETFSHSADLFALLETLKLKRIHLVGLSVGGAIAIDFAIEHPEVVDSLILVAAGLSNDAKAESNLQSLAALQTLVNSRGIEHVIDLTLGEPFVLSKNNLAGRERVRQIYRDNRDVFESGFPIYTLWQPIQPAAEERLNAIKARTLILRGDQDSPAYSELTQKISKGIPKSTTIVISGGTHFLSLEKPAEVNRALRNFLKTGV